MEDKVKLILNKLIYEILKLEDIEKEINSIGIKSKEIDNAENYDIVSKYFFLKNDIYLDRLSSEELNFLYEQLKNIDFTNINISEKLYIFLVERLNKILLPETDEKYLSYYGTGSNYLAPSDAIVLAFHYIKYLDNNDDLIAKQENILYERLNYIQTNLASKMNMKIAVLVFDELVTEKSKSF